ncbi:MAG: LptE family protein [Desulfobacterales bacterium]
MMHKTLPDSPHRRFSHSPLKDAFLSPQSPPFRLLSSVLCLLPIFLLSCGYQFAGVGQLPGDVQRVFVAVLENKTAETGIETILSNDLIQEFTRSGNPVARNRQGADAMLSGRIASLHIDTVSRRGTQSALSRRVVISVDLSLTDPSDNTLWSMNRVTESQVYDIVEGDKQATENSRRAAIRTLSKRLAETVHNRLTAGF